MKTTKLRKLTLVLLLLALSVGQMWATTVYYVNRNSWGGVKIHYWGGSNGSNWDTRPSMSKLAYQVNGFDVYSYDIGNNTTIIFMDYNNDSDRDGGDVSFSDSSKPYYFGGWYESFAACWQVKGTYDSWAGTTCTSTGNNTGRVTVNLAADTDFKLYCLANSVWYGSNGGTIPDATSWTLSGSSNTTLAHTHDGYYVFDINFSGSNPSVTTHAPYQVSYAAGTGATGTVSASAVTTYGSTCTLSSSTFTKTGYTQDGWATSNGGTKAYSLGATYTGGYTDVTLYPHWTGNTYTVTLDREGGTTGSTSVTATYGSAMPSATMPAKTGYEFGGYFTFAGGSGTKYYNANGSSAHSWDVVDAATIHAKWTPITYTIHFDGNGATSGTMSNQTGVTYDAATNITANAFTRTGYTFTGWADTKAKADAGTVDRTNGAVHGNLSSTQGATVTLYAVWTPKQSALTLDKQTGAAGYGSAGTVSATPGSATYDSAMPTLSGTMPSAGPGYKFMGFFDATGGEGTKYYNADGSSAATWDKDTESGTTLYAYYQKAEITALTHRTGVSKGDVVTLDVNPTIEPLSGVSGYLAICWTLHYAENNNEVPTSSDEDHYYSVASYTEGGTKPNQVRFTMHNLAIGSYYVKAVLKASASSGFDPCSTGTELSSLNSSFGIIGGSKVTIQYKDLTSGAVIASSSSVAIEAGNSAGVKALNIIGYSFNSWSLGAGVTNTCADGSSCGTGKDSINISSTYDGILTAFYTKKRVIYFNNTLNWDTVYVYFYKDANYWHGTYGTGTNISSYSDSFINKYGGMTKIAGTNIYYFDAEAAGVNASYQTVVFAQDLQTNYDWFYNTEAIRRSDYESSTLPMYVPLVDNTPATHNDTKYYEHGYWMNYPDNTGYTLKIYDNRTDGALRKTIPFPFKADKKIPISITTDLEGNKTYGFEIVRADGNVYRNANTMSNGHSGDGVQTVWEFITGLSNKTGLTTSSAGNYTFTLNYDQDASSNYNYLVGVRYPESTGDFRVQYKDNANITWKTSVVIPAVTEADTVSYFVRHSSSPYIRAQKCTATWNGSATTVTWNNENSGNDILPDTISADGVYNFIFKKVEGALVLDKVEPYTGNFYIRVDGAGSTDWDSYRAADHIMPFSEYSFNQTTNPYSHYFTKWYDCSGGNKNIKCVVANDYSTNVSDTLIQGDITNISDYIDASGNLNYSANVRFMYNYKTNSLSRAFIDGAYSDGGNFLKILSSDKIYEAAEGGSALTEITFSDRGNWVYEKIVYALPGATYKLRSLFGTTGGGKHVITQWFKGAESGDNEYETLIGGSGESRLQIRLLYDFKTNRLVAAYLPTTGTIDEDLEINADIMFQRVHQDDVTQITFGTDKSISEIQNVYTTLMFNKSTINDPGLSRYQRDLYHISFPYDVRVSDIIGFGEYGKHWIIEYYDGAGRAEKGFWADSESFWTFVTPEMASSFTLKAGTGYIVALDLDELGNSSSIWTNTSTVELIFPGNIESISNQSVTYSMPSHQCNIGPRFEGGDDRRIKDSHWNVLGVPAYHNTTGSFENHSDEIIEGTPQVWSAENAPKYLYTWNMTDNTLSATNASGYSYKAMNAYVVQYYGDVTFHTSTNAVPSPIVARRTYADAPSEVQFRMEIRQNDVAVDQTFVTLSDDEAVSSEFVFGQDMSKEFNKNKANIYTLITSMIDDELSVTEAAGNTLPMSEQTTVVPLGVQIAKTGEYTFAMPEGTDGVGVILIDNVSNTRTNLGLTNYTVLLTKGTLNERFSLEISPIKQTPTGIGEVVSDQHSNVRKVMIDGILYIVKEGKIYDARGARVQ